MPRGSQALYTYLLLHVIDEAAGRSGRRGRHIPAKDPEAPPIFHPYNRVWILPLNLASYSTQQVASVGAKIPKVYLSHAGAPPAVDGGVEGGTGEGPRGTERAGGERGGGGDDKTREQGARKGACHLVVFRNGDALWAFLLDPTVSLLSGGVLTQLAGPFFSLLLYIFSCFIFSFALFSWGVRLYVSFQ